MLLGFAFSGSSFYSRLIVLHLLVCARYLDFVPQKLLAVNEQQVGQRGNSQLKFGVLLVDALPCNPFRWHKLPVVPCAALRYEAVEVVVCPI